MVAFCQRSSEFFNSKNFKKINVQLTQSILFQADYFNEAVLNIEGDSISAVEVAFLLEELRGNIVLRKEEEYFSPALEIEKQNLIENDVYDEPKLKEIINSFYGNFLFFSYSTVNKIKN